MKRDILYQNRVKRPFRLADGIVFLCICSDLLCVYQYSAVLFNEYQATSILISLAVAVCLDASLYHGAGVLNFPRRRDSAVRRRCVWTLAGMAAVFLVAYISLLLMAWMVEGDLRHNWGVWARLLIPIATSILSFFLGLSTDPVGDRLREVQTLQRQVQAAAARDRMRCFTVDHSSQRGPSGRLSPDQFDQQMHHLSVLRVKVAASQAEYDLRLAQAQALGTTEAVDKLLSGGDLLVDPTALLDELTQPGADPAKAGAQEGKNSQSKVRLTVDQPDKITA
mgnify:CR=1 FL=1